jgi:hypothetical protein
MVDCHAAHFVENGKRVCYQGAEISEGGVVAHFPLPWEVESVEVGIEVNFWKGRRGTEAEGILI